MELIRNFLVTETTSQAELNKLIISVHTILRTLTHQTITSRIGRFTLSVESPVLKGDKNKGKNYRRRISILPAA